MRTARRSSRARAHALPRLAPSCTRSGSATWSPTVKSGLRLASGSCRIIAIRLPRTRRISPRDFVRRSSPSNQISPLTVRAAGGRRRRSERASVVFPEPDSPTMPSVSPSPTVSETSSTARVTRAPRALT